MKILFLLLAFICFIACTRKGAPTDSPVSGEATVACDETFLPILEMEKVIFANTYTQSNLKIKYVPDVELFNLLLKDSVRLIVSSRKLTTEEKAYFEKQKLFPREIHIATDAIAIICNKSIQDSIFTLKELKDILTGKISSWKQISAENDDAPIKIVFDNTNSSTVRMIIDSITKNEPLTKNISAVTKNADVIDVINQQNNAIGIIGVSWISDMKDSTVRDFLKKVTVISLTKDSVKNSSNSYKPYQAYIATGKYPLTRNIYIILTEPRHGLASGFCSFLASDRGQRVILKSGILPATQPLRIINMREEL